MRLSRKHVFHETQRGNFCAKHAINNLFQRDVRPERIAHQIHKELRLDHGHADAFDGDWTEDLVQAVLQRLGRVVTFHDPRHTQLSVRERQRDGSYAEALRLHPHYRGAVLLVPGHYVALRRHAGCFHLHDSSRDESRPVDDVKDHLLNHRVQRVFHVWER
jgi:hypothetical protein